MSTEIKTKAKAVQLTQFAGGKNGLMLSINQPNYSANDFDETNKAQVYLAKIISQIQIIHFFLPFFQDHIFPKIV